MDEDFKIDVMAEFAALNMALLYAFRAVVAISDHNPEVLRRTILDSGLRDLDRIHYGSIPPEHRAAFVDNARRRYSDLVTAALPYTAPPPA